MTTSVSQTIHFLIRSICLFSLEHFELKVKPLGKAKSKRSCNREANDSFEARRSKKKKNRWVRVQSLLIEDCSFETCWNEDNLNEHTSASATDCRLIYVAFETWWTERESEKEWTLRTKTKKMSMRIDSTLDADKIKKLINWLALGVWLGWLCYVLKLDWKKKKKQKAFITKGKRTFDRSRWGLWLSHFNFRVIITPRHLKYISKGLRQAFGMFRKKRQTKKN